MSVSKVLEMRDICFRELDEYGELAPCWDGYDALPFGAETISYAKRALTETLRRMIVKGIPPTEIVPGPGHDGSLTLEVSHKEKTVEVLVAPNKKEFEVYKEDASGETEETYPDLQSLAPVALWLIS